ncbi:MAG TPA: VOC family protein [Candidatus Binatia bacterium]|nr:VOC family protein [Candidatus Binatia bacterium]
MAAPSKFAHVVYQTHRFEEMIEWYERVFEATIRHKDDKLAFLSYDDEHHRMAFLNLGPVENGSPPKKASGVGVHHVAYTWKDLGELVDTYKRLKGYGVLPAVPIRHGLTLSLYYQDPDANMMEFQIDLMDMKAADEFMRGPAFEANPVGEQFDPEELAARYDAGKPVADLVFRSDQPESRGVSIIGGAAQAPHVSVGETTAPDSRPSGATASEAFLAKVSATLPEIRERAAETERLGRIPDDTIRTLTEADVFRAVQPRQWGGLEIDPASFWEGMVRIGSACGSTGWVSAVVGVHPFHVGLFPEEAQREIWQDNPDARIASTYAPTGKVERAPGGFRLSGRWGFSSGIDHSDWVLLGGIIPDDGNGPEFRTFLVPARDFTIDQASWQVSGLQGTGSKDVLVKDALVPEHRTHRIVDNYNYADPGRVVNSAYFRMPWLSMFAYAIATPAIGAAVGALDAFVEDARSRFGVSVGSPAALNPALHARLAEALTIVADTRARIAPTWNDFYATVQSAREIPVERRARCRYEATQAIGACLGAVLKVFEVGGGGVMNTRKPFQRLLRDLMAMRNHPFGIPDPRAAAYAKCVLGVPTEPFSASNMAAVV